MAKGLQIWHQLNVSWATIRVDCQDVLGREWIGASADRRMAGKVNRVLDVQRELVVLGGSYPTDRGAGGGRGRLFSARHVRQQPAVGQARAIANGQRGNTPAVRPQQLCQ